MPNLVLPKIEVEAITERYGRFIVGPLESGYGVTIGNSLRRVLLSSLPGAAITSIRVDGIHHEFSPIPGAREDTMTLLLNLKQVRMRLQGDEPVRLRLEAEGEGVVTAGDVDYPSEVEIVNPELHLLTLDSSDSRIEMELVAEKGRGYSASEERGALPIGELPVDAIFSPIRKIAYTVDRVRIGEITDFDQLKLDIWTDGTIQPEEALSTAAQMLAKHFSLVANIGGVLIDEEEEAVEEGIPPKIYEMPVEELDLSVRAFNCLKRAGITKVGMILEKLEKGDDEIMAIRNFGRKSLDELKLALSEKNLLPESEEEENDET
ncbi:MAG: DNA-directed RNA polymerase subunit alpha [Anaerolineae bacterium]|nr:DNA-directed RNA polymerase subunit alpha [Anaerolineae bacterium]NIN97886.1 DNA-directed RNA polymerase subunit alpha [Anaerolineae bacterium]NIQ80865.1 DNA-directed RNA polymerase subunit alpha [Anaerolineae bacterium]